MPIKFSLDKKMIITACMAGAVLFIAVGKYLFDQGYFQENSLYMSISKSEPQPSLELSVENSKPAEKVNEINENTAKASPEPQANISVNMPPVLWAEPASGPATAQTLLIANSSVQQIESYRVELELLNLELAIAQKKSQIQEIEAKSNNQLSSDTEIKNLLAQLQIPQETKEKQKETSQNTIPEEISLPIIDSSSGMKIVGIQTSGSTTTATIKNNGQERTYKVGDEIFDTTIKSISQKKVELTNGKTISWF